MNVIVLKFKRENSERSEIIGVFSNSDLAEVYINRHKDEDKFLGEWFLSDRIVDELISDKGNH
jgi:hypothetical protein